MYADQMCFLQHNIHFNCFFTRFSQYVLVDHSRMRKIPPSLSSDWEIISYPSLASQFAAKGMIPYVSQCDLSVPDDWTYTAAREIRKFERNDPQRTSDKCFA